MPVRTFLFALLLVLQPMAASAQASAELDAVSVSPEKYTVRLENEQVRVVEYEIAPGQVEAWHTHPARVMYVISPGTLRVTAEDGTSRIANPQSGAVTWTEALGVHRGENIGESTVRVLLVEVKSAQQPPGDESEK